MRDSSDKYQTINNLRKWIHNFGLLMHLQRKTTIVWRLEFLVNVHFVYVFFSQNSTGQTITA